MLTKKQLEEIKVNATKEWANQDNDVFRLLNHIEELDKSICIHHWVYFYETGFQCDLCGKERKVK
jgi:hypothetical protein